LSTFEDSRTYLKIRIVSRSVIKVE
jgi:hypothetical protein